MRTRALQYLARREYSRAELRAKLLPHIQVNSDTGQSDACGTDNLEVLLNDLVGRGWLSDERAATQMLHAKRSRFGMQRIVHELRQKGISEEIISNSLPELKESELETAQNAWGKKFGSLPHDAKEKAKQIRFLQSRGFGLEVIMRVLRLRIYPDS